MKFNVVKQAIALFFIFSMLMSCEYEFIEVAKPTPPDPNDTTKVSFSAEIEPIFSTAACTNCHSGSGGSAGLDLSAGNAYNSINSNGFVTPNDPENSEIYLTPNPTGSHFKQYTADQANLVYLWIYQGALDN